MCLGRSSIPKRFIRPNSRWARCSGSPPRAAARAWPTSRLTSEQPETLDFARKVSMAFDPEVRSRLSGALDRQGRCRNDGRPTVRGARRRAQGRSREHAFAPPNSRRKRLGSPSFSKAATAEEMKAWIPLFATLANGAARAALLRPVGERAAARKVALVKRSRRAHFRINKWKESPRSS